MKEKFTKKVQDLINRSTIENNIPSFRVNPERSRKLKMPKRAPVYIVKAKDRKGRKKHNNSASSHALFLIRTNNTLSKYNCIEIKASHPTFDDYEHL